MRRNIMLLGTAALISFGATATAFAGEPQPGTDIRALEAPADVSHKQMRAQGKAPVTEEGRSVSSPPPSGGIITDRGEAPGGAR